MLCRVTGSQADQRVSLYCPVDHLSQDPQQQLNLEYLSLHPHPDMGLYFSAAVLGYHVH